MLERWETPDNDFLRIHICNGQEDKPVALLLHGLEGSAQSTYIVGLTKRLSDLAWSVVAMEHRSCGGEMNRARRMYHSGETTDLAFVIDTLIQRRPSTPIYIAGFSIGGNQTAKWLGESGDSVPPNVKAAAVVSAPYDLAASGRRLDRGLHRAYVRHFLRTLIPKAETKERQYPGCIDLEAVRRSTTFEEFDTHATAALHGFRDAADYYDKVSCGQFLPGIRRPTLLISAADDPFNPSSTLPREPAAASPFLHPQFPERGGHVGFIRRARGFRVSYWAEEQIVRFFSARELLR
jgi:predicted alpha/beta-fold hydrolase